MSRDIRFPGGQVKRHWDPALKPFVHVVMYLDESIDKQVTTAEKRNTVNMFKCSRVKNLFERKTLITSKLGFLANEKVFFGEKTLSLEHVTYKNKK